MQKKLYESFQGFQNQDLVDISFSEDEKIELVEAIELALHKVPVSEFRALYWDEEIGEILIGIDSERPYVLNVKDPSDDDDFLNYTIMGHKETDYYYFEYDDLINKHINSADLKEFYKEDARLIDRGCSQKEYSLFKRKFNGKIINRCLNELIQVAQRARSRFAFQALGIIVLENGAKLPDKVKLQILKNCHWKDERQMIFGKKARNERRGYLLDFKEKLLRYNDGDIIFF
jgi:hypothetical protein